MYVTTAEAKRFNANQNTKASVKYLFVPYGSLSDSAVKVTDAQLQAYLDKNASKYKVEAGRSIEYVTIPVVASKEDSTNVKASMAELATQFAAAPVDSLFVIGQLGAALEQGLPLAGRLARAAPQAAAAGGRAKSTAPTPRPAPTRCTR